MEITSYMKGTYGSPMECTLAEALTQLIANPATPGYCANGIHVDFASDAEKAEILAACEARGGLTASECEGYGYIQVYPLGEVVAKQEANPQSLGLTR